MKLGAALLQGLPLYIQVITAEGTLWQIPLTECTANPSAAGKVLYNIPKLTVDEAVTIISIRLVALQDGIFQNFVDIKSIYDGGPQILRVGDNFYLQDFFIQIN